MTAKFLIRFVTLLMVPCLLVDPTLATALSRTEETQVVQSLPAAIDFEIEALSLQDLMTNRTFLDNFPRLAWTRQVGSFFKSVILIGGAPGLFVALGPEGSPSKNLAAASSPAPKYQITPKISKALVQLKDQVDRGAPIDHERLRVVAQILQEVGFEHRNHKQAAILLGTEPEDLSTKTMVLLARLGIAKQRMSRVLNHISDEELSATMEIIRAVRGESVLFENHILMFLNIVRGMNARVDLPVRMQKLKAASKLQSPDAKKPIARPIQPSRTEVSSNFVTYAIGRYANSSQPKKEYAVDQIITWLCQWVSQDPQGAPAVRNLLNKEMTGLLPGFKLIKNGAPFTQATFELNDRFEIWRSKNPPNSAVQSSPDPAPAAPAELHEPPSPFNGTELGMAIFSVHGVWTKILYMFSRPGGIFYGTITAILLIVGGIALRILGHAGTPLWASADLIASAGTILLIVLYLPSTMREVRELVQAAIWGWSRHPDIVKRAGLHLVRLTMVAVIGLWVMSHVTQPSLIVRHWMEPYTIEGSLAYFIGAAAFLATYELHTLGHYLFGKLSKADMSVSATFSIPSIETRLDQATLGQRLMVVIGGPAFNLIIGATTFVATKWWFGSADGPLSLASTVNEMAIWNLTMGIVALLPISPHSGGWLASRLFRQWLSQRRRAD